MIHFSECDPDLVIRQVQLSTKELGVECLKIGSLFKISVIVFLPQFFTTENLCSQFLAVDICFSGVGEVSAGEI